MSCHAKRRKISWKSGIAVSGMQKLLFIVLWLSLAAWPARAEGYGMALEGFDYPYPVQQFSLQTQGQALQMAYMDVAPARAAAQGRVIVLLHGKNFCGATWEKTIALLAADGFRVIVPDQIGFCKSSKPAGYQFSLPQLASNTQALLQHLGIDRAVVMGHSMGGMLGMRFALMYPQTVTQLLLVNPIGLEDWQAKGVPYASVDDLYAQELKTTADSLRAYQLKFYYNNQWQPEYDRWVDMQAGLYRGEGGARVAYNQAQTSEMIFTQPVVHELSLIRMPVVLFIGQNDRTAPGSMRANETLRAVLGDYPALGKQAAAAMPQATLVAFDGLGHSPQVEAPDVFHAALRKALAEDGQPR